MLTALMGQAPTQSPQPTQYAAAKSMGGSSGASCSSSLRRQAADAPHIPRARWHSIGVHFWKST